jgi:Leucine-rich repeat (LRR) protein
MFPTVRLIDKTTFKISSIEEVLPIAIYVEKLDCSRMGLTELPESLYFPNLTHWDLSWNNLVTLPDDLNLPSLRNLDLHQNELQSLPENLNSICPVLRKLNCGFNQLTALPSMDSFLQLRELRELHCYNNQIQTLPTLHLPNLKKLGISNNHLTNLPENMFLPMLQDLSCQNNPLESLPQNMDFPELINFDVPFIRPVLPSGFGSSRLCVNGW